MSPRSRKVGRSRPSVWRDAWGARKAVSANAARPRARARRVREFLKLPAHAHGRRLQMVFANISRGTFSKYYSTERGRLSVTCPLCSPVCTLPHLQDHIAINAPTTGEAEDSLDSLVPPTEKAAPTSRALPNSILDQRRSKTGKLLWILRKRGKLRRSEKKLR